ncbi:MAG: hypothetical protein OEW66_01945 [Actinomycetota bacterium]|nr:hypothetical protein [Actinomycetota bacterium]MDH5312588.1 hypothetical protein [Actinomycetota bacterium]
MEVRPTASQRIGDDLDRIEAAVAGGNADLGSLGLWTIVRQVKLDRLLVDEHAEQIGRIDTAAFRAGVRMRVPVWTGNALLGLGSIAGALAVGAAFAWHTPVWKGLALVAAGMIWSISLHSPTHWLVGTMVGIRWTDYFLGGPPPPRPGLKSDYGTYLRADPDSRAWMHASGAIATKLAPFLALAFWPGSNAPWWAAAALAALGVLQIATDLAFSTKTSDWKKFRREKAIARARRAAMTPGAPAADQARVTGGSQIPRPASPALPAEPVERRPDRSPVDRG